MILRPPPSPPAPPTLSSSYLLHYWHKAKFVIGTWFLAPGHKQATLLPPILHIAMHPSSKCGALIPFVMILFAEYPFYTCHRAYHKCNICAVDYIQSYSSGKENEYILFFATCIILFKYSILIKGIFSTEMFWLQDSEECICVVNFSAFNSPVRKTIFLWRSAAQQSSYKNNVRIVEYLVPPPAMSDTK